MGDKPRLTAVGPDRPAPPGSRPRSGIAFPYSDLAEVERAAHEVAGSLGRCHPEQLAAWLGHSKLNSGAFRNKLVAGKLFGILSAGRDGIELTALGRRLVDQQSTPQARVEAFLSVPLYLAIFEAHRGRPFPGKLGLELEMLRLGVSRSQVRAARRVFLRSARHTSLLEAGDHQLVLPRRTVWPASPHASTIQESLADGPPDRRYPKVIDAILEQAPWNEQWSEAEFDEWSNLLLQALRVHFRSAPDGRRS